MTASSLHLQNTFQAGTSLQGWRLLFFTVRPRGLKSCSGADWGGDTKGASAFTGPYSLFVTQKESQRSWLTLGVVAVEQKSPSTCDY